MTRWLFYLLIFPGFLFTTILGLLIVWVDRKVSARVQFRQGPPLLQNFNDIFKLFGKETLIVKESARTVFVSAPIFAFGMIVLLATIIGLAAVYRIGFAGDLIVVMYLMMIFSVAVILGGGSSGNVYSSLGAGREIKLLLADELVFILVCLIPIIRSGYKLRLDEILAAQESGAFIGSFSGAIGFALGLLCIQAKMTLPPFHIPEAETEIVEGPFMEYSGPLLAFWKLSQGMMYVIYPAMLVILFLGGFHWTGIGILYSVLKYLLIVVLMILIKNTNPRIRIDTALKFFWCIAAPACLIGVVLSVWGL